MRHILAAAATAIVLSVSGSAWAQTDMRVRGTLSAVTTDTLTVETAAGEKIAVKLAEKVTVIGYTPIKLQDVPANAYVAAASTPQSDGSFKAISLIVFPEAMRGMNEGTKGWDLGPQSRMTNATVAQLVSQADGGRELTVRFGKDNPQTQKILLTPQTPVSTFAPADRALVAPGAKVVLFATKAADGTISTGVVGVGTDGKVPPV